VPSLESADLDASIRPENRRFYSEAHCRVSQTICQAKKASNRVERLSTRSLIALQVIPVQKWVAWLPAREPLSPDIYSLSGLVGQAICQVIYQVIS
jgi:hypothetical protein